VFIFLSLYPWLVRILDDGKLCLLEKDSKGAMDLSERKKEIRLGHGKKRKRDRI